MQILLFAVSSTFSPTTQEKMVFHRFDSFLNRLNTMVEFFNTAVQVMLKESYCTAVLGSIAFKSFHIPRRNENISPPQFLKLEKVEIGGIRGKALTSNINKVYEEFRVSKYKYLNTDTNINMAQCLRSFGWVLLIHSCDKDSWQN